MSNVRRLVRHFQGGEKGVHDKPRPGQPCTAVIPRNEERLDQLIRADWQIKTNGRAVSVVMSPGGGSPPPDDILSVEGVIHKRLPRAQKGESN